MTEQRPFDRKRYGAQIYTLEQLDEAARRGWLVAIHLKEKEGDSQKLNPFGLVNQPQLATWVLVMSGKALIRIFAHGLFQYKKKEMSDGDSQHCSGCSCYVQTDSFMSGYDETFAETGICRKCTGRK